MVFHGTILVFHRAERRRREARHETYITPKLVTTRRSTLGPPAEGRPGPSDDDDDHITCAQVRRKLVGEEDAKAVKQQQGRRRIQLKQAGTS